MRLWSVVVVLGLLLGAPAALAKERWGVTLPDAITVEGQALKLNGMGLRVKLLFVHVYVGGLYLEAKTSDAAAVIRTDAKKRVVMSMLMDLTKQQIADAILEGFKKNNADRLPSLKERLDRLIAQVPDKLAKGQTLTITYLPGQGTRIDGAGRSGLIEGKDFGEALFAVWFGRHPVDEGLMRGMLGQG